jgi:hypothetical protein
MIYIALILLAILLFVLSALLDSSFCGFLGIVVAVLTTVSACTNSEWYRKQQKELAAEQQRWATPHVIQEVDGCKVYAFKTDRYHYFTRCGDKTTTEASYSVNCGKSCTRTEVETITTENKK